MDTLKQTYRDAEVEAKKAVRDVDGHDAGDDIANAGDEIRKDLANAGDEVRKDLGNAGDDVRRHNDTPRI
jgi:hypothetical protein